MVLQKKLVISNWKNYVQTEAEAREILESVNDYLDSLAETKELPLVFCPINELIPPVSKLLRNSHLGHCAFLGSQDRLTEKVQDLRYSIIGHSSRRWGLGETDEIVNAKLINTLNDELIPIVCIGERDKDNDPEQFIKNQIEQTFKNIAADKIEQCIIAYEPVWAITGDAGSEPDTSDNAGEKIGFIKNLFIDNSPKVLYGGSVNSENILGFITMEAIDGVLIGKASSNKNELLKILSAIINSNK